MKRPSRIVNAYLGQLEHKPQTVLDLAAVVSYELGGDLAKIRAGEINNRIREIDVIEHVV